MRIAYFALCECRCGCDETICGREVQGNLGVAPVPLLESIRDWMLNHFLGNHEARGSEEEGRVRWLCPECLDQAEIESGEVVEQVGAELDKIVGNAGGRASR